MSRATGGARPWNESAGRVGQRHLPRPPTSALIDAPRQSNFRLRASFFVAIITTATTPDSHPDCRALLIQIVALHEEATEQRKATSGGGRGGKGLTQGEQPLGGRGSDTEPKCRVDPNDGFASGESVTKSFIARRLTRGRSPVR